LWNEGHDFDLVYMGYGSDSRLMDDAALLWPDRLFRTGLRPVEEVAAASRTAVGALVSLRAVPQYADARPIKAMSGLASGCPVVYAGQGDFAHEIADQGLGFFSPWDVDGVAVSMRAALDAAKDAEGYGALRARCAAHAQAHFDDGASATRSANLVAKAAGLSS
jgi:glycosyltransferase involved in cell wall biosynthesis